MKKYNSKALDRLLLAILIEVMLTVYLYAIDNPMINEFLRLFGLELGQIIPLFLIIAGIVSGIMFERIFGESQVPKFVFTFLVINTMVILRVAPVRNQNNKTITAIILISIFALIFYLSALASSLLVLTPPKNDPES